MQVFPGTASCFIDWTADVCHSDQNQLSTKEWKGRPVGKWFDSTPTGGVPVWKPSINTNTTLSWLTVNYIPGRRRRRFACTSCWLQYRPWTHLSQVCY